MLVIAGATLADGRRRDVRVDPETGTIDAVGQQLTGDERLDASGRLLLPGMIDAHVHFREPGARHKETWATGSRSAAAGGVTTVVDQPNTDPPTVTGAAFDEKVALAGKSLVDWGINGGVVPGWKPDELLDRPVVALGEIFLADSTGELGIDGETFEAAVRWAADAGIVATVHAERADQFDPSARNRDDVDAWSAYRPAEAEIQAVKLAGATAQRHDARLHVAHVSTPEGADLASAAGMTCEVTPHHLLCARADLESLGTRGKMNPPLRGEARRAALFERVADGTVDIIATDHAPHTLAEKDADVWRAPSGVPGVETALPLLLEEARQGRLAYDRVRDLVAANPADVFDLSRKGHIEPGRDADLVLVDPDDSRVIRGETLHSTCGWTPFEGRTAVFPEWTMVRGAFVYRGGTFGPADGRNVRGG